MNWCYRAVTSEVENVWQELVRMVVTWVVMCGLVAFFYWMLGSIGTF
ncbi:MAG: hypothetical protein JO259_01335 [Mycobacterium sp.]|nr:hypothetical protein [Mycobacterium sp.]